MNNAAPTSQPQIDEIVAGIDDDTVAAFARAYLRRLPSELPTPLTAAQLRAQAEGLFAFAAGRGAAPVVRVYDPDPEIDGYPADGSVVELVVDDSPFLVDSVTAELQARGKEVTLLLHPVIGTARDGDGRLTEILPARSGARRESVQHYELDSRFDADEAADVERRLVTILRDVGRSVSDFKPMRDAVRRMIAIARSGGPAYDQDEIEETASFLGWLLDDNYVLLGYRRYSLVEEPDGKAVMVESGSGLGILKDAEASQYAEPRPLSELAPDLRKRWEGGDQLVITKTNRMSTVHRRARMDYIGVRIVDDEGRMVGEARLVGLFTSQAYMAQAAAIPVLHRKLQQILEAEDLMEGSHDHKLAIHLFETFPKDELFATPTEEIRNSIVGLMELEERQHVRLFVRRDLLQRNVAVLVAMPREGFNAGLRQRLQQLFKERFNGSSVDYRLSLGDSGAARIHFTVWVKPGEVPEVAFEGLEAEVIDLTRTWDDRLMELLQRRLGTDRGTELAETWCPRLPDYYKASNPLAIAAGDLERLDELHAGDRDLLVGLQTEPDSDQPMTRLAVYRRSGKLSLSAIMPTLEDLGLRVVEEVPTKLRGDNGGTYIHDFAVLDADGTALELETCAQRVSAAVAAVLDSDAETDTLHRLLINSSLDHGQLAILRAYRTYWRRVGVRYTVEYMNDALASHPHIAGGLVRLFEARFDPDGPGAAADGIAAVLREDLDRVASLEQDRILRGMLELIEATVRTNAYRPGRRSLSFKFRSADVPDMPEPVPLCEIFVYAPDTEGIHLRGGMVARGGLRWSIRQEDYRTEVLGLMKAQMTKNALIVPTGAKGGFVLRRSARQSERAGAVADAYVTFISGLLDITDNRVGGTIQTPDRVVAHDGPDPYLVVAADRGTATFSDLANEVAAGYRFWLGDAFASGGSSGYDHKALGITARGAWESVKWHFRSLGIDPATDNFTAVGIGDMSGDVFGNGMLQSDRTALVAAFDHRHIFVDPTPNPARAFAERRRLFDQPGSSWADYDASAISAGGGVWPRDAKLIELSPEAKQALGIDSDGLTPADLIRGILSAPVDLLWNGGVGTFVKASTETNELVGDRGNDALRIDATELRARVVGEGGNLGLTQRARIEYAMAGGAVNTDFIDNSGGVDCSDREVNLKILLGLAEERGELDRTERDTLIEAVSDDVVARILYDSFLQAQILGQEIEESAKRLETYEDLMVQLEAEDLLLRELEGLPGPEEMTERARTGTGLTGPELAVLLAYAKRSLRTAILASDLPDRPHFDGDLSAYFPDAVSEAFGYQITHHPLRRELVATIVSNEVVNSEGITFVSRLMAETGAEPDAVVRAYRIARRVTRATRRWEDVEALVDLVDPEVQNELMHEVDELVESTARWYLANPTPGSIDETADAAAERFDELVRHLAALTPEQWREDKSVRLAELRRAGVPHDVAHRHIFETELLHGSEIIDVAGRSQRSVGDVADAFYYVGAPAGLDWLGERVALLPAGTRWHRRAAEAVEDDLRRLRRTLAERVLAECPELPPQPAVEQYLERRRRRVDRLDRFLRVLAADGVDDVASAVVAMRQVESLLA